MFYSEFFGHLMSRDHHSGTLSSINLSLTSFEVLGTKFFLMCQVQSMLVVLGKILPMAFMRASSQLVIMTSGGGMWLDMRIEHYKH